MTKIDDEMVERATRAYLEPASLKDSIRAALEAALSPKPEPEIEVSEGMRKAGTKVYMADDPDDGRFDLVTEIYRAMESTRLKEAQTSGRVCGKVRTTTGSLGGGGFRTMHIRSGDLDWSMHSRKGDAAYAAKSAPQGVNAAAPERRKYDPQDSSTYFGGNPYQGSGAWVHVRKGETALQIQYHRRKDDPR